MNYYLYAPPSLSEEGGLSQFYPIEKPTADKESTLERS